MVPALVTLGVLGVLFGIGLYLASRVFHVEVDPRVEKIEEVLPGANCGACGFPGCAALAEAIAEGRAPINACPVGAMAVALRVGEIMGVKVEAAEKKVAVVKCQGREVGDRYRYSGPGSCRAAHLLLGGPKECPYGCLGLGDCVRACPFGAITLKDGLPVVDEEKCTGCGLCAKACPRGIIEILPVSKYVHVLCSSTDSGALVRKYCQVGCIGCKRCEKTCPHGAIKVENFLARIDYEKCVSCGECVKVCPVKCIVDFHEKRQAKEVAEAASHG